MAHYYPNIAYIQTTKWQPVRPRFYFLLFYSLFLQPSLVVEQVTADPQRLLFDGPSIVALKYRDGVIVAAETRSPGSSYQPHHWPDAIRPLSDHLLIAASGGADSRARWQQLVPRLPQDRADDAAPRRTVRQLANALRALQSDKDDGRGGGEFFLVGLEEEEAQIYFLNHGALLEETGPFCVAGRESAFLTGCLEGCPDDLEEVAAVEMCRQALQRISHGPIQMYLVSRHRSLRQCIVRPGMSKTNVVAPSAGS
jgi:20S proteasome alpha/beta subunit